MQTSNEIITIPTDNVDKMLTIAEDMAERQLGEYMNDASIPVGQRNARYIHQTCLVLGKVGNSAGMALRQKCSEMYTTAAFKELRIPVENDATQFVTFEYFDDWLRYAIHEAGVNDTAASALGTFIQNVVDPVARRLVTHTDGTPFEVNEVLSLREGHTQRLASAAKTILKRDPDNYNSIGELLEMAQDPETTAEDLGDVIRSNNLSRPRIPMAECNTVEAGDKIIYTIIMDNIQQGKIDAGLNGRVDYRSRTSNDMMNFWETYDQIGISEFFDSIKDKE